MNDLLSGTEDTTPLPSDFWDTHDPKDGLAWQRPATRNPITPAQDDALSVVQFISVAFLAVVVMTFVFASLIGLMVGKG